jgi:hypothetical protein
MTTNIVVGTNFALPILNNEEGEACLCNLDIISCFLESKFVGYENPLLGEDGTAF